MISFHMADSCLNPSINWSRKVSVRLAPNQQVNYQGYFCSLNVLLYMICINFISGLSPAKFSWMSY